MQATFPKIAMYTGDSIDVPCQPPPRTSYLANRPQEWEGYQYELRLALREMLYGKWLENGWSWTRKTGRATPELCTLEMAAYRVTMYRQTAWFPCVGSCWTRGMSGVGESGGSPMVVSELEERLHQREHQSYKNWWMASRKSLVGRSIVSTLEL